MRRAQLFQIRFAATATLLVLAFLIVRLLWFPGGYFALLGIATLLWVLVGVNIVIGPILSTILFKPGKWGLKFDLVVIACIEVAVLCWGMAEIYSRRPAFVVFAVDRFEVVTRAEIDSSPAANGNLVSTAGPMLRLIYAELPTDPEVMNQLIDDTVFLGKADIDRRPEFWRPYASGMRVIKAAAMPASALLSAGDDGSKTMQRWLDRRAVNAADYLFLPIKASSRYGVILLHADIGYPVAVLAIDPWPAIDER